MAPAGRPEIVWPWALMGRGGGGACRHGTFQPGASEFEAF